METPVDCAKYQLRNQSRVAKTKSPRSDEASKSAAKITDPGKGARAHHSSRLRTLGDDEEQGPEVIELVQQNPFRPPNQNMKTSKNDTAKSPRPELTSRASSKLPVKFTTHTHRRQSSPRVTCWSPAGSRRPELNRAPTTQLRSAGSLSVWPRREEVSPSSSTNSSSTILRRASEQPASDRLRWLPFRNTVLSLVSSPKQASKSSRAEDLTASKETSSSSSGFSVVTKGNDVHELMVERDARTGSRYLNRRFAGLDL